MSMTEDQLCRTLTYLRRHVSRNMLQGAMLFLRACKVPHGDLETVDCVSDLYGAIQKNQRIFPRYNPITVLQCALQEAGVPPDKVNELGRDEQSLQACRDEMKQAKLVLRLNSGLTTAELKELKNLARDRINIHPDNIATREYFFYICLNQRVFEKEKTLMEFKGWLEAINREDLTQILEEYIDEWKQAEFALPRQESQKVDHQKEDLVSGAPQTCPPVIPSTASSRGIDADKDTSTSVRDIDDHVPPNTSVQVQSGSPRPIPSLIDHYTEPTIEATACVPDDPSFCIRERKSEEELLIPVNTPRRNIREPWCHRHRCKITFGGIISISTALLLALLAAFFLLVFYHSHVNTRPMEVELRPEEDAAVECGQDHWLIKNFHLEKNATADDSITPYNVGVYSASDEDLEMLKQMRLSKFSEDVSFKPSYSRLTLPRGTFNRLPYLMPGSSITVFICLGSNSETLNIAYLYVFNNRFASDDYIDYYANSASEAVHNSSLTIGTNGSTVCHTNEYPVTRKNSGYYYIVLEVPIDQINITVNYSISAHVAYINSSNLTEAKSYQIPSSISFSPSFHVRTLLCFLHKTITTPNTAYLIAETRELFSPLATKIGGFSLLCLSVAIVVLFVVILVIDCIVYIHVLKK